MESFKKYFFRTNTPRTRQHQQASIRGFDRKHLNQVPHSRRQQAQHPVIDNIIKTGRTTRQTITPNTAREILDTYAIEHDGISPLSKAINRTGITISFNPVNRAYTLTKK